MPGRRLSAMAACALVALAFASGCGSKYAKVEQSFAQPINCSTAQVDIRALEEDKVSKTTEAAAGMSYALPTTIIMGAITEKKKKTKKPYKRDGRRKHQQE